MSIDLFHNINDERITLRHKGVYYQGRLYQREGRVYASWGDGFVALLASGATSKPDVSWEGDLPHGTDTVGFYFSWVGIA